MARAHARSTYRSLEMESGRGDGVDEGTRVGNAALDLDDLQGPVRLEDAVRLADELPPVRAHQ